MNFEPPNEVTRFGIFGSSSLSWNRDRRWVDRNPLGDDRRIAPEASRNIYAIECGPIFVLCDIHLRLDSKEKVFHEPRPILTHLLVDEGELSQMMCIAQAMATTLVGVVGLPVIVN